MSRNATSSSPDPGQGDAQLPPPPQLQRSRSDEMKIRLRQFDASGSGTITAAQLAEVLPNLSTEQIGMLMERMGAEPNGRVDFDTLCEFLYEQDEERSSVATAHAAMLNGFDVPDESDETDERIWLRRERLTFPGLDSLGVRYNLPLFLPHGTPEELIIADSEGNLVNCCQDHIYESAEHKLFWLDRRSPSAGPAILYMYTEIDPECFPSDANFRRRQIAFFRLPEDVVHLADFFRSDSEDVLSRWQLRAKSEAVRSRISVETFEDFDGGMPSFGGVGQALKLDPAAGAITLIRSPPPSNYTVNALLLRAHFYDDGIDHDAVGQWLGVKSPLGSACLGLAFGLEGCYSFLVGKCAVADSGAYYGWQRTPVSRSPGWHMFEIFIENGIMHFSVDEEPVAMAPSEGENYAEEEVWLVSRCGGCGVWAGVELFHVPRGRHMWESMSGERRPWGASSERGRWQVDDGGIMRDVQFKPGTIARVTNIRERLIDSFSKCPKKYYYESKMDPMLGNSYVVLNVNTDGMIGVRAPDGSNEIWWLPPHPSALVVVPAHVAPVPQVTEEAPTEDSPDPPSEAYPLTIELSDAPPQLDVEELPQEDRITTAGGLAIECWSIAGEEDIARMERVMSHFVEILRDANVALPDNIRRVGRCQTKEHSNCFVYNFGMRRVHVATRVTPEGRLLLVVRCGGGFIDFVEFARRHGSLEQVRFQKKTDGRGPDVMRLTSVMSRGKVRTVAGPRPNGTSSPSPTRANRSSSPLASRACTPVRANRTNSPGPEHGS